MITPTDVTAKSLEADSVISQPHQTTTAPPQQQQQFTPSGDLHVALTDNTDKDLCYCFLAHHHHHHPTSTPLSCTAYPTAATTATTRDVPIVEQEEIKDNRTDLMIFRDIMMHFRQMVTNDFKMLVDNKINRDSSVKEVSSTGTFSTPSMLKAQMREWKKLHPNIEKENNDKKGISC